MVIFGGKKLLEGSDFGDDRCMKGFGCFELVLILLGQFPLLIVMVENYRAVLRADVVSLAIERGRVVCFPENLEQFRIGDLRRIVGDLDHFGVAGLARGNLLVGWVLRDLRCSRKQVFPRL